jgi:hypothetical protein
MIFSGCCRNGCEATAGLSHMAHRCLRRLPNGPVRRMAVGFTVVCCFIPIRAPDNSGLISDNSRLISALEPKNVALPRRFEIGFPFPKEKKL